MLAEAERGEDRIKNQYEEALAQFELDRIPGQVAFDTVPDLESIKQSMGLSLPPAAATMRYSANIKTDAVIRFGIYALLRVVRKALKKPLGAKGDEEIKALQDGVRRMKRETERSILEHFKDYQENIKFQYVLRLLDVAGSRLFEGLTEHFRIYVSDLNELIDSMSSERSDKEQVGEALGSIEAALSAIHSQIESLRRDVDQLRTDSDPDQMRPAAASSRS